MAAGELPANYNTILYAAAAVRGEGRPGQGWASAGAVFSPLRRFTTGRVRFLLCIIVMWRKETGRIFTIAGLWFGGGGTRLFFFFQNPPLCSYNAVQESTGGHFAHFTADNIESTAYLPPCVREAIKTTTKKTFRESRPARRVPKNSTILSYYYYYRIFCD